MLIAGLFSAAIAPSSVARSIFGAFVLSPFGAMRRIRPPPFYSRML
jgi:hypothetical protein